jgi:Uma2 family endonuclease
MPVMEYTADKTGFPEGTTVAITGRRLTLDEFLALPEEKPALEYFDGEVTQKVAPQGKHSLLTYRLAGFFNAALEPKKLGFAFPELRTTYAGQSPVPDLAVYRWERIPRLPNGEVDNRFPGPADVAIEIVSPDQGLALLRRKCASYVANGTELALIAHPERRVVWEYRPGQPPVERRGSDVLDFGMLLPGLTLTVDALFDMLKLR